ncbi:hypothetical protein J6590_029877 [Homalodisca vitripennis]|nr:hypothetical protein J6590_029877 [Homalodisca vitripennis]
MRKPRWNYTKPYNFGYSVNDRYSGADFKQQETSDGNSVKGQYRVQLPDGRTQIVTYTADWQTGFHADVRYEGEASYPAVYGIGGSFPPSRGPSSSYGPPQTSYGAPQAAPTYSAPPQSNYGAPSAGGYLVGTPYQARVGVAGTGTQYNNIDYSRGGSYSAPPSTSYGHPHSGGYRK